MEVKTFDEVFEETLKELKAQASEILEAPDSAKLDEKEKFEAAVRTLISLLLMQIGVPVRYCGFTYLKEAITLCVTNGSYNRMITKTLYPEIAKKHHSCWQRIERTIRYAIETAWEYNNELMSDLLGVPAIEKEKPTNSEFVSVLAERIRLAVGID